MAWPTTYQGWIDAVTDWLDIATLPSVAFDTFLSAATARLNRELDSQHMEKRVAVVFDTAGAGGPVNLPLLIPDFNRVKLVNVAGFKSLDAVTIDEMVDLRAEGTTGDASFYCIDANELYIYPQPSDGTSVEIRYYQQVPDISTALNANVFTSRHPDLFLYAALTAAELYVVEDERLPVWQAQYRTFLDSANVNAKQSKYGSTPLVRGVFPKAVSTGGGGGGGGVSVAGFYYAVVDVSGAGDYTLVPGNVTAFRLIGTLTGNRVVLVPPAARQFWFDNRTVGPYTLHIDTSTGSANKVLVNQGKAAITYTDGAVAVLAETDDLIGTLSFLVGDRGDVLVDATGLDWSRERTGSAKGDGVSDDTAALQSVLDSGRTVVLGSGKSYFIKSRLVISADGTGIVGDGSPLIVMGSDVGEFDNIDSSAAARYGANGVGVYASGIARPTVKGVRIRYETQVDDRYVRALAFEDCTDITVENVEAWNFTKGFGILAFNDCIRGSVSFNHVHSCTTDSITTGQITGIGFDYDAQVGCSGIAAIGNRIHDITVGPNFLSLYGYQTDGINLAGGSGKKTAFMQVANNWISNVGEGIDTFGDDSTIVGNTVDKCYIYGLKFVHGASRNAVHGNVVTHIGFGGIVLAGTSIHTQDTADNLIFGNVIRSINPDGAWAASSTFGVGFFSNGGTAYLARRNKIWNNHIDGGGTGANGVRVDANSGDANSLNSLRGNHILNVTTNEYLLNDADTISDLVKYASPLQNEATANLATGFTETALDLGTVTGGTVVPDASARQMQYYVNNGAHTLAPPTGSPGNGASVVVDVVNGISAGTVSTGGFDKVTGDAFAVLNGNAYRCYINVIGTRSHLHVVALQ
jgi:hypothetical protein